jgi:hypothetical protein
VVFCLLLLAIGAVTLPGGINKEVPKSYVEKSLKLEKSMKALRRAAATAKERHAYEAYEKRDTKTTPWMEDAELQNPDNAALLYYQAFLLRPDPDTTTSQKIDDVLRGGQADRQVRTYLGHCLPMIQMAEIASRIPQCTWGIWHGPGPRFGWKDLHSEVNNLKDILVVDARILAADGHYRAALERCLMLRRFAHHLSDSNVSGIILISWSVDKVALHTAQHVLGVMPPNTDILTWFRGQLALKQGVPLLLPETLQANFKSYLNHMRTQPSFLARLRDRLVERAEDEQAKENTRNLTDAQILSRASEGFLRFFDSIFQIVDSEMTYEQKCAQMQRLINKLKDGDSTEQIVELVMPLSGTNPMARGKYPFQIGHVAHINGIKASVEVHLVLAKTGQLPKTLPDGLPKDPFTGRSFVYEITDEGFALRCQGEDFQGRGKQVLEFKVKR